MFWLTFAALAPFALLLILMVVLKQSAKVAAPITLVWTLMLSKLVWQMDISTILAAGIKGALTTFEILFIVFGAMSLLKFVEKTGVLEFVRPLIEKVSLDQRIQAILIGFFLVSLIEGAAGFGTPAMIAAPILILLGFRPITAVAIALIGNSTATTFGAVGVPVSIGLFQGVGSDQVTDMSQLLKQSSLYAALIHTIVGSFIPLLISITTSLSQTGSVVRGLKLWRYSLFAGLCFTLPYLAVAALLGYEFPSILGALFGLAILIPATKKGWFLTSTSPLLAKGKVSHHRSLKHFQPSLILVPYGLVISLLIASRVSFLPLGGWLKSVSFGFTHILGSNLNHTLTPLYSPGFIFLVSVLASALILGFSWSNLKIVTQDSLAKITKPALALLPMLFIVNLLIASGNNSASLPSMPVYLASQLMSLGAFWPLLAPSIGALGAFVAGSSTVSNLLFSSLQVQAAQLANLPIALVLAGQVVGSAAGNMIAVHNIIAASAVVGLVGKDSQIIRTTLLPILFYVTLAGLVGLVLSRVV